MRYFNYGLSSLVRIVLLALGASFTVFASSLVLQWLVYDIWLHRVESFRVTGTVLASTLTFLFLCRWQLLARQRQREMQARLETIRAMNDKIRNALQIIGGTSYLSQPNAAAPIREAIDAIDAALREGSALTAGKIIRGCEYVLGNERTVEEPYELDVYFASEEKIQGVLSVFGGFGPVQLGPGFRVRRAVAHDDPNAVMYKIDIWNSRSIYASIMVPDQPHVDP